MAHGTMPTQHVFSTHLRRLRICGNDTYGKDCERDAEMMTFSPHGLRLPQLGFVPTAARMDSINPFPRNGFSTTGMPATDAWRKTAGVRRPLIKSAGTLTPCARNVVTSSS